MRRKRIGIFPLEEKTRRTKLFRVLEEVFAVSFQGRNRGEWAGLDGAVLFPGESDEGCETMAGGPSCLSFLGSRQEGRGTGGRVVFRETSILDARLRGLRLCDRRGEGASAIPVRRGDTVLAVCGEKPVWVCRQAGFSRIESAALAPQELATGECLRDHFESERFLSLLPLVHFLRQITSDEAWTPPALRACFVIDDANLHWPTYGHLRFKELARRAERDGFHVAIAMPALDGWFAHPGAVRIFRDNRQFLSILVHGNNHVPGELCRCLSRQERNQLIAQTLLRVAAFEKRSGISVSRLLAAPHELCSEEVMESVLRLGFEAICRRMPCPRLSAPPQERPLAGWLPADLLAGGLPVLLRRRFADRLDDLPLQAFLDQPVVLYGHHADLASGLDRIADLAAQVNALGSVQWTSLTGIARSNFATKREGRLLRVRMYSRRICLEIPDGIEQIIVDTPTVNGERGRECVVCGTARGRLVHSASGAESEPLPVTARGTLEIRLVHPKALDPKGFSPPPRRLWPVLRRGLTEGRDRLLPMFCRR